MDKEMLLKRITIHDGWISVDGIGRIGMYDSMRQLILLDYGMKFIVGSNDSIKSDYNSIKENVCKIFIK